MNALEISMDSYTPNFKEKVQKRHDPSAAQECLDFICWKTMIQVQILENSGLKSEKYADLSPAASYQREIPKWNGLDLKKFRYLSPTAHKRKCNNFTC